MRLPVFAVAVLVSAIPAQAFENELLGKRDVDVPAYKSEQGALLFNEKGDQTTFAIDYGSYKKNYVILLMRDTGAKTNTDSTVFEIVQVVRAPKPKGLDLYTVGCYLKPGTEAPAGQYVFAYAQFKPDGDGTPSAIKGAWMFDWQTQKIVTVPDAKIDCREPGD
ncbi:MAG TPA: hypothetical protein PL193_15710 [Xanthobacteraceae bacterium]|nr:hypothetical protein [Xanthobacteraceae bacterium]